MIPFILLLILWAVFRVVGAGLGVAGVDFWSTWTDAARWALAGMFLFTARAHFGSVRGDLERMIPPALPMPGLLVTVTGLLEILGAVGILLAATRQGAGLGLVVLMVLMFPANVSAARREITIGGMAPTRLGVRLPIQLVLILITWWATQSG
jgi:uncharacterized membrane protein